MEHNLVGGDKRRKVVEHSKILYCQIKGHILLIVLLRALYKAQEITPNKL